MAGFVTRITVCLVSLILAAAAPPSFQEGKMPASCEGKTYCYQKSDNYPQHLINGILDKLDHAIEQGTFGNELDDRYGTGTMELDDCQREIRFEPIYEIVDSNGLVRFVIQSETKFLQQVKTETCLNPGRITTSMYYEETQLSVMNLTCTEKKMEYWFQVLSLDGETFEHVAVKDGLPVCCSCRLTVS